MPIEFPADIAATIPEDIANHTSIQRYNDLPSLMKGHIEAESYRGRSIALPNGESKPEEMDKWASEQGAKLKDRGYTISKLGDLPPADAKEYDFKIEGIDEKVLAEDKLVTMFKPLAHKLGLSKAQASGIVESFVKDFVPQLKTEQPEFITGDAVRAIIDKEFPGQTEATIENYVRSIDHLKMTAPDLPDLLNESVVEYDGKTISLGDHPTMVKLISALAQATAQDFGGNVNGQPIVSKEGAALVQEAEDIIRNPSNSKHKLFQDGDKSTHEYVQGLYKKAYPGETQV